MILEALVFASCVASCVSLLFDCPWCVSPVLFHTCVNWPLCIVYSLCLKFRSLPFAMCRPSPYSMWYIVSVDYSPLLCPPMWVFLLVFVFYLFSKPFNFFFDKYLLSLKSRWHLWQQAQTKQTKLYDEPIHCANGSEESQIRNQY